MINRQKHGYIIDQMSFTVWFKNIVARGCLIAAAVILCTAARAQENNVAKRIEAAQTQQAASQTNQPLSITVVGPIGLEREQSVEPDWAKLECVKPRNHDEADLCEQRRMARAAEDAVEWAALQTKFGILGFAAVIISLGFTGWAAFAASQAAKAAQSSVDLAADTAQRQLRAYVSVDHIDAKFQGASLELLELIIEIAFKNTGQTPAVSTSIRTELGIIKDKFVQVVGQQTDAHQVIGSNGTRVWVMKWKVKTDHLSSRDQLPYALFQLNIMYGYEDYLQRKWSESFEYRCATHIAGSTEIDFTSASGLGFGAIEKKWGG